MEIPLPSLESIGKFFGGIGITVVGGWLFLKKIGLISKTEEEIIVEEPVTKYLRRSEDTGVKVAIEAIERRVDIIEKRFIEERGLMLGQIRDSEARVRDDVNNLSERVDGHYQGINERLDILIKK